MTEMLTLGGYQQTKAKLRDLEMRLALIEMRSDLATDRLESVRRSYRMMMREYLREIKLYEAKHKSLPSV